MTSTFIRLLTELAYRSLLKTENIFDGTKLSLFENILENCGLRSAASEKWPNLPP